MRRWWITVVVFWWMQVVGLSQPNVSGVIDQALQNELRVDTVEVHLRVEIRRPRYTRERMRQWRFSEDVIQQAYEEMNSLPETESARVRLRFDNRNKLFEGTWESENYGSAASLWSVLQGRTLTNERAVVNEQVTYSQEGKMRKYLDRSVPVWPPLAWQSEIWRYRIWHSHLPKEPSKGTPQLKIKAIARGRQLYGIHTKNAFILYQMSQHGPLLTRYTVTDLKSGYPEYEEVFAYMQTETGLPYPSRVTVSRYLVPPENAKELRIPHRTPIEITTYTVESVRLNPVLDKAVFEEGLVAPGTFVQDNRFDPPLTYVQGNRQFSEKDLFQMAQNRELLQDADWMGYRPKPTISTYAYLLLGLAVSAVAVYLLNRTLRRKLG